jgi:hypothetical protein
VRRFLVALALCAALALLVAAPAIAGSSTPYHRLTVVTFWDQNENGIWGVNEPFFPQNTMCIVRVEPPGGEPYNVMKYRDVCYSYKFDNIPCGSIATVYLQQNLPPHWFWITTNNYPATVLMDRNRCVSYGMNFDTDPTGTP